MRRIRSTLGSALVALVAATAAAVALWPSNGAAQDASPAAGGRTTLRTLAPSEIIVAARRAGFESVSRPIQRGPVYIVFAVDGDDIGVKLTVDAHSGRLLWVADVSGTRYGGYYGYPASPLRARAPMPPADIPNVGPDRNNFRSDRSATSVRRSPPLPRTRPGELTSAVNKDGAAPAEVAAPLRPEVAPGAKPAPVAPTMAPIAPLE